MPQKLSDEAQRRKNEYNSKYVMDHQVQRKIVFNDAIPEDRELLAWLDSKGKGNRNQYVKGLIRDDMNKAGK